MHIHLFYRNKIEGEALRLLLMKKGHQVVFSSIESFFKVEANLHKEGLFVLDIASLSSCKLSQAQIFDKTVVLIGHLEDIHWFFKFYDTSRGFICKDENIHELLVCINRLSESKISISRKTSDFFQKPEIQKQQILLRGKLNQNITATELKIMHEIALGKTAKIIAREWHRSIHTIYNHRKNIMKKLRLDGKIRLNKFCYQKDSAILSLISLSKNQHIFKNRK